MNLFAESALMGRVQIQNQKDMDAYIEALVRLPAPISPNQDDARRTDAPTLPFVSQKTGD